MSNGYPHTVNGGMENETSSVEFRGAVNADGAFTATRGDTCDQRTVFVWTIVRPEDRGQSEIPRWRLGAIVFFYDHNAGAVMDAYTVYRTSADANSQWTATDLETGTTFDVTPKKATPAGDYEDMIPTVAPDMSYPECVAFCYMTCCAVFCWWCPPCNLSCIVGCLAGCS